MDLDAAEILVDLANEVGIDLDACSDVPGAMAGALFARGEPASIPERLPDFPNGFKSQQFIDTPREGQPAIIHHKRRRWGCKSCGATTYEHLDWAEPGRGFTRRCAEWVFKQSIKRSFKQVLMAIEERAVSDARARVAEIRARYFAGGSV